MLRKIRKKLLFCLAISTRHYLKSAIFFVQTLLQIKSNLLLNQTLLLVYFEWSGLEPVSPCLGLDPILTCLGLGLDSVSTPQSLGLVSVSIHSGLGHDLVLVSVFFTTTLV